MKHRSAGGLIVFTMILYTLPGCTQETEVFESRLATLGTFARISIAGLTPEQARAAADATEQTLKSLDHIGYGFGAGGELQRVNDALANGRTITVSGEMTDLLDKARGLSLASGGLFNPAAGELTALWKFQCEQEVCVTPPTYPTGVQTRIGEKVARVLERTPSMDDLMIRGNRVSSRNRRVRLDFGEVIRTLALDIGIERLRRAGATNAMIEIGGNVHASGTRGDHAWWVGIPDASGRHLIGSIETGDDESVVTVRALDTSAGWQDSVYRRIVDPRNGLPAGEVQSVTVVHHSAMLANAAATALMIAGRQDWKTVADRMDVPALLMIDRSDTIYTSPAIDHRIHWKQGVTHQHLVP